MNIFERVTTAVKAFRNPETAAEALKALPYPSYGTYGGGSSYGYGTFDKLTDPWPRDQDRTWPYSRNGRSDFFGENPAVAICLGKIADQFADPEFLVEEFDPGTGEWTKVLQHDLPDLIAKPNPYDDGETLWTKTIIARQAEGNSYWYIRKTRGGVPIEIRFEPPWMMKPKSSESRSQLLSGYTYTVDAEEIDVPLDRVVHFKYGNDRRDRRLGCARLKYLYREIASDEEATEYTYWILRNMGVVGGILTVEDDEVEMTEAKADKIRARYRKLFTGSGRGDLMIPTFKSKYQEAGKTPEQMALDKIRMVPEDRICAALNVPQMVAGLTSGAAHKTYNNLSEAREAFYEECLIPTHRQIACTINRFLLPMFPNTTRRMLRARWCYDNVRVLQPDQDRLSTRKVVEFRGNGITLNEFRRAIGQKEEKSEIGSLYFWQIQQKFAPKPGQAGGLPATGLPDSPGDRSVVQTQDGKPPTQLNGNTGYTK